MTRNARWYWHAITPRLRERAFLLDTLLAIGVVLVVSAVIALLNQVGHVSNISNLYIIGTAVLAARRGLYPAILASILAFMAYDWFFIPPVHRVTVDDPSEYVALLTLLVTSVLIGQLLARVQSRAAEARRQQTQTELLYEVSEAARSGSPAARLFPFALRRLGETLGLQGARLVLRRDDGPEEAAAQGTLASNPERQHLLRRVIEEGQPQGVWRQAENNVRIVSGLDLEEGQTTSPEGGVMEEMYIPLLIEGRAEAVLVVGGKTHHDRLAAGEVRFLQTFANQLASAIQRYRLADQRARARALEESDRLKSALVSSVSHELKTPLTAIKASATALREDALTDAGRQELVESIDRETDRLTGLVSNLLDMSRLEAGAVRLQIEWVSIVDVVADVLDRLETALRGRHVSVQIAETIPPTPVDFALIGQVLANLLDNAARYSPPSAGIVISAEVVRDQLRVTVFNEGSSIRPADLEHLFDKFYRANPAPGGTGLGLAIARSIVEAHGGRIWAENVGRRGVAFNFTLPSPPPSPPPPTPAPAAEPVR
jgi:two-component system sensor histidine kinase KdpD